MKVSMIGPIPPPGGGVESHIIRLRDFLDNKGDQVFLYDSTKISESTDSIKRKIDKIEWFSKFLYNKKVDIIHIHWSLWREIAFLVMVSKLRGIKVLITFHSFRYNWNTLNIIDKLFMKLTLKYADYIICAGEKEKENLIKWYKPNNISVIQTFIMPQVSKIGLPKQVTDFIDEKSIIISANGSSNDFYNNNDMYGIDMSIELCSKLVKSYDIGIVFCLSNITDLEYFNELNKRIDEYEIRKSFLFITGDIDFCSVLGKSHIFIRPTNTYSYGISIAEAIALDVPSLASDVCIRPNGTILFESRNMNDLYEKVCEVINNYIIYKKRAHEAKNEDCTEEIIKVYNALLK